MSKNLKKENFLCSMYIALKGKKINDDILEIMYINWENLLCSKSIMSMLEISDLYNLAIEITNLKLNPTPKKDILNKIEVEKEDLKVLVYDIANDFEDKEDINKLDLFWLDQAKTTINNLIHLAKKFNSMDDD